MIPKGLMAASSKPIILTILSSGRNYGYGIIQKIKEYNDDQVQWSDGMLYPLLHKLEKEKLISSEWEISADDRKRKYYSLTSKGGEVLKKEKQNWLLVHNTLMKLWGYPEANFSI